MMLTGKDSEQDTTNKLFCLEPNLKHGHWGVKLRGAVNIQSPFVEKLETMCWQEN